MHMPDILVDDSFEDLTGQPGNQKKKKQKEPKAKKNASASAPSDAGGDDAGNGEKKGIFGRSGKAGKTDKPDKAEKPGKAGKAEKDGKTGRTAGAARTGKKEKGILFKVLVIVIPVLLVSAFVFEELSYNKLGLREKASDILTSAAIWVDPQHDSARRTLRLRKEELDRREADIAAREERQLADYEARLSTLSERKAALDEREDELDAADVKIEQRTEALDKREQDMNDLTLDKTPIYKRALTEQEITDLKNLSSTFAAMAPDSAAEILVRMYDPGDVAVIIYYMSSKNAAAVMSAMDPAYAANLTQLLISD